MQIVNLQVLLMDNNELLFNGKSLGFITEEEKEKYIMEVTEQVN